MNRSSLTLFADFFQKDDLSGVPVHFTPFLGNAWSSCDGNSEQKKVCVIEGERELVPGIHGYKNPHRGPKENIFTNDQIPNESITPSTVIRSATLEKGYTYKTFQGNILSKYYEPRKQSPFRSCCLSASAHLARNQKIVFSSGSLRHHDHLLLLLLRHPQRHLFWPRLRELRTSRLQKLYSDGW